MHAHVSQNRSEYRDVPLTALTESASNPRKRFDENSLSELAAYVSRHISGVLCPGSFCAENVHWRARMAICIFEGHITSDRGELCSVGRYKSPSKLSDSAEPHSPVCPWSRSSEIDSHKQTSRSNLPEARFWTARKRRRAQGLLPHCRRLGRYR